jgi:hypothetical protein
VTVFETETMAELCVKQGLVSEARAIYRRLVAEAPDDGTRARRARRLAELARGPQGPAAAHAAPAVPAPSSAPGPTAPAPASAPDLPALTLARRADALIFTWSLPAETASPALQVLLVRRGPAGIETETRTLPLEAPRGTTRVDAAGLHSVRAAAGWLDGARFVPLVRLPDGGP